MGFCYNHEMVLGHRVNVLYMSLPFIILLIGRPGNVLSGSGSSSRLKLSEAFDEVSMEMILQKADDKYLQGYIAQAKNIYKTVKNVIKPSNRKFITRTYY